jgi:glycine/D-amino acid oxidase-like deaminating enzyme
MPNNFYKVGATYHWFNLNEETTEEARKELTEKLEKLTRLPYKITKQVAGIRPATMDRKPFIGQHPKHENMYIFNGFGAKGVSLVPYFAAHFADVLLQKIDLDVEVDIKRIKKHK